MPKRITENQRHYATLALIVIVGILLRVAWPTLAEFKLDESTVARRALSIAYEGDRPSVGVPASVSGLSHMPLNLYLMALPLRLWNDPTGAVIFSGLLEGVGVLACYLVARAYLGRRAGLIAAALFACNPWAVLYARKIWSLEKPLFVMGFIAPLLATFARKRPWVFPLACLGYAALWGLHSASLIFVPIFGLTLLLYRDALAWKPLLVGGALFTLAVSPYLYHDATHSWSNLRTLLAYGGTPGEFSLNALYYPLMISTAHGIAGMAGPYHTIIRQSVLPLWNVNWLVMGSVLVALGYALHQALRAADPTRRRFFTILLLWFTIPVAQQLRPSTPTYPHYFVLHYPLQFLLLAALADAALTRFPRPVLRWQTYQTSLLAAGLTVGLVIWSGWQISVLDQLRLTLLRQPSSSGFGIPLRYPREAAQAVLALDARAEVIVISDQLSLYEDEVVTAFAALLFGRPHRFTDGRGALPLPAAETTLYLAGPLPPQGVDWPALERLRALDAVRPGPVTRLPDGASYQTFIRTAADRADVFAGMTPLGAGIPLANGGAFVATELPASATPGTPLTGWIAWWQQGPPPETAQHLTVRLVDAAGRLLAQYDHASFPTTSWQPDDVILHHFALPLPADLAPGSYTVRAGLYTYPDLVEIPVVDGAGNPVEVLVTLGEVAVTSP